MPHRTRTVTLGRQTAHRLSMLRNLATSLLEHKRIVTTEKRAKETQRYVESIIEEGKKALKKADKPGQALAHKRRVFSELRNRVDVDNPTRAAKERLAARELLESVAKRYLEEGARAERKGGYTRITRIGSANPEYPAARKGDGALMVILELVD